MTSIFEFIAELDQQDIKLWLDGDRLRINAPKGRLSPTLIAELKERKMEIMAFLREYQGASIVTTIQPLDDIKRTEPLPLSFAQQRLWFLEQLEGTSGTYNIPVALRLCGPLDVAALSASWQVICERHEGLRTTFPIVEGQACQKINPPSLKLEIIDLSDLPPNECFAEVARLSHHEANQPFDLTDGPLLRVTLLRLSEKEHVLLVTMHHIISDGWSMGILLREFSALYAQEGTTLPELPVQYADFAVWQRKWLSGEVLQQQLQYWKTQLADAPALLTLPTDHTRPAVQSYRGDHLSFALPKALHASLINLSSQSGTTLFMTLQAAFAVLLWRYSGQEDILIGTPIANRQVAEVENLIGFFVNTLVLRNDLSGNPTFRDFLSRVRQVALDAYQHQALPFELLVETVQPERSLSHSPLFQVMFTLDNNRQEALSFSEITISPIKVEYPIAKFDLTLTMEEYEEGLIGSWEYNTDLFEHATIERMAAHFQTLLKGIVANPDQTIGKLPLLSESEKQKLLVEWNNTNISAGSMNLLADSTGLPADLIPADYASDKCIHQLFEQQAQHTPDAVAVMFPSPHACVGRIAGQQGEAQQLTYRQLNARANQVARYLIRQGVEPDALVGICVERSIEMVVGLLGILKAGGAYLPLDPAYPKERLAYMLSDGKVQILLTQQSLLDSDLLPINKQGLSSVCLDTEWQVISQQSNTNPISGATPDNLAYVIYTSGSTGMPKGVAIHHRNLVNAYRAWEKAYQLRTTASSHLQMASFSFDVFSGDLVRALCSGGKLVLCPREWLLAPEKLYQLMLSEAVDTAEFVPAVIKHLVEYLKESKQDLAFMRLLIVGSDSWYMKEYRDVQRFCGPRTRLINSYGVTEATIDSSYFEKSQINLADERPVPIGRPFGNMQLYILDHHLQPAPVGVPGQLHIGGAGLARGYLNRPQLTAKKFIANPFAPGRLYKTGDLSRYLPDGNIEFLGRTDYQVKIRGFRIELGEIEAVLNSQVGVHEAVVMVREMATGKRLVAYVVGKIPSRSQLISALPDYMVPNAFVGLETMPLTPNGKIDRRALPAPEYQVDSAELVLPRTPVEAILAGIWQEVLDRRLVGIHDNFFELGGHSLLATQVVSRIRQKLKVELPLRYLFSTPTIIELAKQLNRTESSLPPLEALDHMARAQRLPLSFAQQRLWFLAQLDGMSDAYNMPTALRLDGPLDIAAFSASWQVISERHEALRTTFPIVDGQAYQQINSPNFKLEIIDLSHKSSQQQEADVAELSHQSATYVFDLSNGPLWRVSLLRLSENSHVVLLCMHHIISDGWSIGVLIGEFSALYSQKKSTPGATLSQRLPELSVQYADFAVWQRSWLQGEVLKEQLHYWKAQLANAPALLTLPTDYPRPAVQSYHGHEISFPLPKALHTELASLSAQNSMTLFMTLQAAFAVLLWRYSGQEDILIGTPIANRQVAEVENLIGFFVNTLVLRNDLSGNPTFRDFLSRVRQVALDAYQHQALPFELLVETVQPERSLSHSPLFQVMFTLDNNRQEELSFSEITISPIEVEYPIAKFDLTLTMEEYEEGLIGSWEYNTDLFERATIERMAGHFQTLLEGIVANSDQAIGKLPLLSESEKQKLLVEWNDTHMSAGSRGMPPHGAPWGTDLMPADVATDKCIHQLFEQQAQRTPNAVALIAGDQQLTYQQLNARANQLAHTLVRQGIGPDVLVGICIERSIEMAIGLLGILKAGGAYLPLDPSLPEERLRYILSDSGVELLLTESKLAASLADATTVKMLNLDQEWLLYGPDLAPITRHAGAPRKRGVANVNANHLAYCIYTSGSTGKPKGVLVEHKSLVHHCYAIKEAYALSSRDRVLQFAALSFDVAAEELFPTWLSGATVVLHPASLSDWPSWQQWLENMKLTVLNLPAPYWHDWVLELSTLPPHLRLVVVGSDKVLPSRVAKWQELSRGRPEQVNVELIHAYGISEDTITTTLYKPSESETFAHSVPIGRPLANSQLYILDQFLQPVPIGVPGQLHIGGAGLARGYLNRPQLTGEKFIQNPFALGRLYKTGDLSRYLPDGNIEFLGRTDYQVKIRGFRIELGEIETALNSQVGVDEAVVVLYEKAASSGLDKQLVAYVVGEVPSKAQLRETLPDYMIPSAFVRLETMPLTPNGKIDRRALTESLSSSDLLSSAGFIAPRNQTEQQLANIWQEVLGLHSVGVRDSFFDLGGHSLLAVRLMAQIQANFEVNLPLATLFQSPTIEQLASQLNEPSKAVDWPVLVPIRSLVPRDMSSRDKLPFFCVPGAGGNVIYLYDLARFMGSRPFYGLQAVGLSGETTAHTTVEAMAAHYIKAIQSVQPQGPYLLAGHSFGGWVAFEMAQQLLRAGHDVAHLMIFDSSAPTLPTESSARGELTVEPPEEATWDNAKWLMALCEIVEDIVNQKTILSYESLLPLDFDSQLIRFKEELERLNILPTGSDLKQVRGLVEVYKTNNIMNYVPCSVIPTPITLFQAFDSPSSDSETEKQEAPQPLQPLPLEQDPTWGWNQFAKGPVSVISVPGKHITMMRPPHVEVLAERLRECLHRI